MVTAVETHAVQTRYVPRRLIHEGDGVEYMLTSLRTNFRNSFIAGLVVIFPVVVTVFILKYLFGIMAGVLSPLIRDLELDLPNFIVDMVSVVCLSILIYLIGVLATMLVGRKLISIGEMILTRLPVVRSIYNGAKDVAQTFSIRSSDAFKRTVIVEYPRPGMFAVGFVTGNIVSETQEYQKVFVPTAPNPTSGYLVILRKDLVIETDVSPEDAIKTLVSAGTVCPDELIAAAMEQKQNNEKRKNGQFHGKP